MIVGICVHDWYLSRHCVRGAVSWKNPSLILKCLWFLWLNLCNYFEVSPRSQLSLMTESIEKRKKKYYHTMKPCQQQTNKTNKISQLYFQRIMVMFCTFPTEFTVLKWNPITWSPFWQIPDMQSCLSTIFGEQQH